MEQKLLMTGVEDVFYPEQKSFLLLQMNGTDFLHAALLSRKLFKTYT